MGWLWVGLLLRLTSSGSCVLHSPAQCISFGPDGFLGLVCSCRPSRKCIFGLLSPILVWWILPQYAGWVATPSCPSYHLSKLSTVSPFVTNLFLVVTQSVPGCHWLSQLKWFEDTSLDALGHICSDVPYQWLSSYGDFHVLKSWGRRFHCAYNNILSGWFSCMIHIIHQV